MTPAQSKKIVKPFNFSSMYRFRIYILECAIRDRESFLDAMSGAFEPKVVNETMAEISVMKQMRRAAIKKATS